MGLSEQPFLRCEISISKFVVSIWTNVTNLDKMGPLCPLIANHAYKLYSTGTFLIYSIVRWTHRGVLGVGGVGNLPGKYGLAFYKNNNKKRVEEKGERGVMEKGKKLRGRAGYGVEFSVRSSG
jgi:hypothetical protein